MKFALTVMDASDQLVLDGDQVVSISTPGGSSVARPASGTWSGEIPEDVPPAVMRIEVNNRRFQTLTVEIQTTRNPRTQAYDAVSKGPGMASVVWLDGPPVSLTGVVILSRLVRVDTVDDPTRIEHPDRNPNWFHKQLTDDGSFFKGDEKPLLKAAGSVLGPPSSDGAARLNYDMQTPVRPDGRSYVFELNTATAPRLILVWHSNALAKRWLSGQPPRGAIGYHFYYHPTPGNQTRYPYGKDAGGGQPHVFLGYRHLMFETWASVQHFYSGREAVFIVPVGAPAHMFGEAGRSLGIRTIIHEVNLALHRENGAQFGEYQAQPVGRVAVSGFSAGANFMIRAMSDTTSPLGQQFANQTVKEIYSWDGAIGGRAGGKPIADTVPESFGALVARWWKTPDQRFRVYTQKGPQYGAGLDVRELKPFVQPDITGPAGSFLRTWAKDGTVFGTLLHLPGSFFRSQYLPHENPIRVYQGIDKHPTDKGFPSYIDTHHWFMTVFMYHALVSSGFHANP